MALTEEQKLENFKHILECFVATIEWAGNYKEHEAAARQFPGHVAYVQPRLDAGTMYLNGKGYKRDQIQSLIDPWEAEALAEDHYVSINVFGPRPMSKGTYLSWTETWINVKANVELDATQGTKRVRSLYVCHNEGANAPADLTMTLEELGLFDGQGPNDNLKRFWQEFKTQLEQHDHKYGAEAYLLNKLLYLLRRNRNVVLTGAPGTGKTYLAKQMAQALTGEQDKQEPQYVELVQFHPSYDFTDFVEGLRPKNQTNGQLGFALKAGIFKEFCAKAKEDPEQPFVFIIDEINRGEVSKIFGELFYAIDPDYRGTKGKVKTQYQTLIPEGDAFADGFYVPDNVYLIATMNDIDRSVESIDFAFRRRFTWFEVKPEARMTMLEVANLTVVKDNADQKAKLEQANFTVLCQGYCQRLNQAIRDEPYLGAAYEVGPAYFLKTLNYLDLDDEVTEDAVYEALESVWNYHLEPLLREYLRGKRQEEIDKIIEKLSSRYYDEEA